ncbi:MAG TPA: hypothetical protein VE821_16710, partial [Pyrinomonadaceae bacterium]|nr:hypothetical protein [Pyrinomonadaceae bacterium]
RLEIEPTATGGRVRLTATNLPPPNKLAPNAHVYLVWATGGRILRLGELHRDARGNAALEFAHPTSFQRYSLIVTAEQSKQTDHPGGAPVFSTRAGEVPALFVTSSVPRTTDRDAHVNVARPVVRARRVTSVAANGDFYASVDEALTSAPNARDITLVGTRRAARHARGQARVGASAGTAYVRALFQRVPPPARFGANRYALWATTPEGRSHYLGSLPRRGLNNTNTYVRAGGVDAAQFDLLVTAERGRHVRGTRRVLATVRSQRVYQRPRRVGR